MKNRKGNVAAIAVIIVIVAIMAGITGYMFANKAKAPISQTNTARMKPITEQARPVSNDNQSAKASETIINESQVLSEIVGWNIYGNKMYGYTIAYPKDWFIDTTSSETAIRIRGSQESPDYLGGDTTWGNYEGKFNLGNIPKDLQQVYLIIEKNDASKTLDEFIKNKNFAPHKKEYLQVNGVKGVRMTFVEPGDGDLNVEHILLMQNGLIFNLSNSSSNLEADSLLSRKVLETMMATIKFTK